MTMTFTRSLLATAVMVGLTACGSGGGNSGNNGATNSSTNMPVNTPVTKIEMEKLPGQAKYSGALDKAQSSVMGDARSGTVNFIADFTKNNIVGEVNFDKSANYRTYTTSRARHRGCNYVGCQVITRHEEGNYATVELENTTLTNQNSVLAFNGKASGVLSNDGDKINIQGSYQGQISGQRGEKISGKLEAKSHEDVRYAVNGVFNGEKVSEVQREQPTTPKVEPAKPSETVTTPKVEVAKPTETATTSKVEPAKPLETATTPKVESSKPSETITVPVVTPTTENTPKEVVWDKLPAVPKFEESSIFGYGSNLKGKATYFSQNVDAYGEINGYHISSKADGKSYVILNADFDNKKINGSAAFNLYSSDNVKKAQTELEFKEATLYKSNNWMTFNGETTGKILTETLKAENLSGFYNGSTDSSHGESVDFRYNTSSSDKNIKVSGSKTLYKQ
ncbi:hypothetical protein [Haemophilus seminalis]|uniref:Lipoprotein n=1 Tax=Haemophilus seminalis TaxID=2582921 RepID=A0ABQ6SM63_9PAST|nr:hypothetical protein [Haemophilus seminalis]KAA5523455.1 hypothetical protein F2S80_04580 [Haemophilus seminalis]